jgi:hypothetical protein
MARQSSSRAAARWLWVYCGASFLLIALVARWQSLYANVPGWTQLESNTLATVALEQALYEAPQSNHFFIHVRFTNRTLKPLGCNLFSGHDLAQTIYPHRWELAPDGQRSGCVDEMIPLLPCSPDNSQSEKARLLAGFKKGSTAIIPAGGSLDYYRECPSGSRTAIENSWHSVPFSMKSQSLLRRDAHSLFFVQVRGYLVFTNGQLTIDDYITHRDIALPMPLHWGTIPAQAHIITGAVP